MAKNEMEIKGANSGSFTRMKQMVELAIAMDYPLFIDGTYGIGKSAGVEAIADEFGYALVAYYTSQLMPEDAGGIVLNGEHNGQPAAIRGMPDIIQRVQKVREETGKPVVLFLDELNSGSRMVMTAVQSLILTREAAGYRLPDDTRIVAAGNTANDMAVVEDIPMPVNNRMFHYHYEGPTFEEWQSYALQKGVHPAVLAYLKQHPQDLVESDQSKPEVGRPRSWEACSRALYKAEELNHGPLASGMRRTIVAAFVGGRIASNMDLVFQLLGRLTPAEECLANPEVAAVPEEGDLLAQYTQTLLLVGALQRNPTLERYNHAMTYLKRVNGDLMHVFWLALINSNSSEIRKVIMANPMAMAEVIELGQGKAWARGNS